MKSQKKKHYTKDREVKTGCLSNLPQLKVTYIHESEAAQRFNVLFAWVRGFHAG